MLFKPWNDLPTPRHQLDDGDDEQPTIPNIHIHSKLSTNQLDRLFISPHNIQVLFDTLPLKKDPIGTISIKYPESDVVSQEDFNEEEQLYTNTIHKVYKSIDVAMDLVVSEGKSSLFIAVPILNPIVYNLLSRELLGKFSFHEIITLAPVSLTNTINKLVSENYKISTNLLNEVPLMKPPAFVTGISGSINSMANIQQVPIVSLGLNAEGIPGYEKLDNDSILDGGVILGEILGLNETEKEVYLKEISKKIRKFNSFSNSGMYI